MANAVFEVEGGLKVGEIQLDADSGSITVPGTLTLSAAATTGYGDGATAIVPKAYVDTMAVVFGM